MTALKHFLTLFWLLCISGTPILAADIDAGERKASTCVGCHGPHGRSANPQRPNLAAQQPEYLVNQMNAYKKGTRNNPMMQSMAINLKEDDIDNLAAYFSSLPAVSAGGEPILAKAGQTKTSTCLGCHGGNAEGIGQIPRLAGQHPEYLERQLNYFKTGVRKNAQMQEVAASLSEVDIKELSAYFGSL